MPTTIPSYLNLSKYTCTELSMIYLDISHIYGQCQIRCKREIMYLYRIICLYYENQFAFDWTAISRASNARINYLAKRKKLKITKFRIVLFPRVERIGQTMFAEAIFAVHHEKITKEFPTFTPTVVYQYFSNFVPLKIIA